MGQTFYIEAKSITADDKADNFGSKNEKLLFFPLISYQKRLWNLKTNVKTQNTYFKLPNISFVNK